MEAYRTRLKFITYLQVIGIILVVLGHSFHEYPDGEFGHTLLLYRLLYNVRMPTFTFVSGFLMYYTSFMKGRRRRTMWEFTANKVKRLFLIARINRQHGTHITPYAESIGLGSTKYELVEIGCK